MKNQTGVIGKVLPLDRLNVDTDAILPKQFMKSIVRSGLGKHLFDAWRYLDAGELGQIAERQKNPDFVMNQARFEGATILLARDNFGCGSSREHAVWALEDYGITAVIAPSFGDIFYGNCYKNRVLAIKLAAHEVDILFQEAEAMQGYSLQIDLEQQSVRTPNAREFNFALDAAIKYRVMNGLNEVALTLQHGDRIAEFENARIKQFPWLFGLTRETDRS